MPYCKKCGKNIKGKARFCPNCGASVKVATEGLSEGERMKLDLELRNISRNRKAGIASMICGILLITFGVAFAISQIGTAVRLGIESNLYDVLLIGVIGGGILTSLGVIVGGHAEHQERKIKEALG